MANFEILKFAFIFAFFTLKNANLGVRRFTFALAGRLTTNPNTQIIIFNYKPLICLIKPL